MYFNLLQKYAQHAAAVELKKMDWLLRDKEFNGLKWFVISHIII